VSRISFRELRSLIETNCSLVSFQPGRRCVAGTAECRLVIQPPDGGEECYAAQLLTDHPPREHAARFGFHVEDAEGNVDAFGKLNGDGSLYFRLRPDADPNEKFTLRLGDLSTEKSGFVEFVLQVWRRQVPSRVLAAATSFENPPKRSRIQPVGRDLRIDVRPDEVPFGILAVTAIHQQTRAEKTVLKLLPTGTGDSEAEPLFFPATELFDPRECSQYQIEAWPLTVAPASRCRISDDMLKTFRESGRDAEQAVAELEAAIAKYLKG
jgi:hypothetical protein